VFDLFLIGKIAQPFACATKCRDVIAHEAVDQDVQLGLALIAFAWRAHRWPFPEEPHADTNEPKATARYLDADQITSRVAHNSVGRHLCGGCPRPLGSGASECPLWVNNGHQGHLKECPLYPRKRTSEPARACHLRRRSFGSLAIFAAIRRACCTEILLSLVVASPTIVVRPNERPSSAVVSINLIETRIGGYRAMLGKLPAVTWCLSFLLMTAIPFNALAKDERPVPPLPIDASQATARNHARALSEMADTAARDSARCQSSGAALGSQAYKKCRALLEDKMSIEQDGPSDWGYTGRSRN